jgi:fermentation-respiration switch protein FrsA (DUF1100 family)
VIISLIKSILHEITLAFNPGEWTVLLKKLRKTNRHTLLVMFRNLVPQALLYYVLLSPIVAAPLYNLMLFHPTMTGPFNAHKILGTKIENVYFPSHNGKQLHGWYLQAANTKHVVLISHGNGGNLTYRIPLIAMFLRNGVSVFIYDYQGYGRSAGSPSVEKLCEDGNAAFDWLISEKGYHDRQIIVFGESLGTGVACQIAARRSVGGIILQSAYSSLIDLARQKILWLRLYPDSLFPKQEQLNNADILSQPHAPLLLVHGEQDRLIPVAHSEQIYRLAVAPKTLTLLPDAGHNDIYDVNFQQYNSAVQQFLSQLP